MFRSLIRPFFNFLPSPLVANKPAVILQATRSLVALPESSSSTITTTRVNTSFLIHNSSFARNPQICFYNPLNNNSKNTHQKVNVSANQSADATAQKDREVQNINNNNKNTNNNAQDKATPEQLAVIENHLQASLPQFFKTAHPLKIYTQDISFIDNIRGVKVKGLAQYSIQLNLIKLYHLLKYASIKVELLNLVKIPEESCIRIRWRITTKPGVWKFIFFFWKYNSLEDWRDGISTFYVNNQAKVFCHVCDNIDVDIDVKSKQKQSIKNPLVNRGLNV